MRTDDLLNARHAPASGGEVSIDWLATPGRVFSHPQEVLEHPALEPSEKRIILASWASDVRAVENEPWLRQTECGAIVPLQDILAALRSLDGDERRRRDLPPDQERGGRRALGFRLPLAAWKARQ